MGALSYVALLLAKYAGELATVAHEIHHDDPGKRERGRRRARRYLKHRLYALKWCVRQLEVVLPAVAGEQAEANAAFELRHESPETARAILHQEDELR